MATLLLSMKIMNSIDWLRKEGVQSLVGSMIVSMLSLEESGDKTEGEMEELPRAPLVMLKIPSLARGQNRSRFLQIFFFAILVDR